MTKRQQLSANANQLPREVANIFRTRRVNGHVFNLSGVANAALRQSILGMLTGKKVSKSKSGVWEVWDALIRVCNAEFMQHECLAVQRDWLRIWILRYN